MANLQNNGTELHRYFSAKRGALVSVRSNGVTLYRTLLHPYWRVLARKKADVTLEDWKARKDALVAGLAPWKREVRSLPSMATLQEWNDDGICETPTGHRVEPDGTGPDGVPSWLRLCGLI